MALLSAAADASAAQSRGRAFLTLLSLISLPIVVVDQATKHLISTHMEMYQSISVLSPWLDLTYTLNPGAAFSLFINAPPWFRSALLFTLSGSAIVLLLVLLARSPDLNLTSISLALILAGASGNLIDRVRLGRVVDFIHVHYQSFHYPIFNVADSAITVGVIALIAHSLLSSSSTD